jgi:molybdopterin/thiamine biosynthesis adenylyltransferase
LLQAIADAGLLRHPRRVSLDGDAVALIGQISIKEQTVELGINVDPLLRHHLPIFALRPWDALGFIPHIDSHGTICFLEHEGIVFDWRRPFDVVRESFDLVRHTLRDGVTGANHADFVNEFEVYWQRLQPQTLALADVELSDAVREIVLGSSPNARTQLRLADDIYGLRRIAGTLGDHGPWSASRAIYLPLETGTQLVPPRYDQPFWKLEDVRRLLTHCSAANRDRLAQLVGDRIYKSEYLIVRLPRPAGGEALFGIQFDGVASTHPLLEGGYAARLTPIAIVRRDKYYLVQRGGGAVELAAKRVLLIGCGAVGGHVAWEMARAGVEQITLVDPDILRPENTYRHVLGKRYWGQPKARALQHNMMANLPFARMSAVMETIEHAIAVGQINLQEYDLIVSAMGNPTAELALNERVRGLDNGPPIVFTWLEPLGIGGHAVLTGVSTVGCFECLYTALEDSMGALQNRASFAAPNQIFHRALTGCDSAHTPFGSLDAAQTAQLAARLAIDALTGSERRNCLRSWKGSAEAFAASFELSPRYRLSRDELAQQEARFASPSCRVCGQRQG